MVPDSIAATTPQKTVSPRHALLENLIAIATRHVNDQFGGLTTRLAAALADVADLTDARLVHQRFRAGNLLKNNSYAFLHLYVTALERALRKELASLSPAPKLRVRTPVKAMTLVPYEEMDQQLAFSALAKPFDTLYSDHLATLNVRLAFLFDRDILKSGRNPFRPDVFLRTLQEAWCEFEPDVEAVALLLPLMKPEVLIDLGPMLDALNLALMRKGVLPGGVDAYQRRQADAPAGRRTMPQAPDHDVLAQQLRQFFAAPRDAAPAPAVSYGAVADEFAAFDLTIPGLSGAGAATNVGRAAAAPWRQGAAAGFHGPVDNERAPKQSLQASRQPLLSYLARLQQTGDTAGAVAPGAASAGADVADVADVAAAPVPVAGVAAGTGESRPHNVIYLPGIKASAPAGSLTRADENTIDLLAAIFETVFQDQNIAQEIRDLIRFLQIPVLKAALADKDFFFQESHPARKLIELLSRMGWEQRKGPQDPVFEAMQRSVERVGRDAGHELNVFAEAVAELEAMLEAEEKEQASAMAAPIASALKQEKMAGAARSAKDAVAIRLGSGEVVAVLVAFLENRWVSVLTIAYSVEDSKPGAIDNATRAMDELIWSVKPKLTAQERKQLIAKLPALLATLNKWLDIIQWQDAERLQFFAELAECHASIVRAPLDMSAERRIEIAVEVAQKAAEQRLATQAQAAAAGPPVAAGDEQAEAPMDEPEGDDAMAMVAMLQRGMWLQFAQADGSVRKVKLAWISPLRSLFIFATSLRQEAFSMADEVLARQFRDKLVEVLASDDLVGRALSQALASQAAVNDDAGGTATVRQSA
jgi:hypothetical protein